MALTALQIKALKAKNRPYKVADEEGLCIAVTTAGRKLWRWRYRFAGRPQTLSLGKYPDISLEVARRRRDEARALADAGKHPGRERKAEKVRRAVSHANDFESWALAWHQSMEPLLNPKYHKQILTRLKRYVFAEIGFLPISEIGIPEAANVVEKLIRRGKIGTAKWVKEKMGQIFRYAALKGACKFNPAADLRGLLPRRRKRHFAAVKPQEFPDLLKAIDAYEGEALTKAALNLVSLTFVRTNELISAKWSEIDFKNAEWNIPGERMKMRRPHFVPLSRQSIVVLRELQAITGRRDYIFHSARGKTGRISNGAMLMALRKMKYAGRMTGHGFRTVASTILNEKRYDRDVIEAQLAHGDEDEVRSAYNRAEYREERIKMMQDWADHLDRLKTTPQVAPLLAA